MNNTTTNNNKWDQFQSTPKLIPPTVFEKTAIESSNSTTTTINCDHNNSTSTLDSYEHNNVSNNHNFNNHNGSQFLLLSNELEKMKNELTTCELLIIAKEYLLEN